MAAVGRGCKLVRCVLYGWASGRASLASIWLWVVRVSIICVLAAIFSGVVVDFCSSLWHSQW